MAPIKSLLSPLSLLLLAARSSGHVLPRAAVDSSSAYDYIVVGGGTCGLAVASRLTENSNVTVLVIEAGESVYDNANVTSFDGYQSAFNTAIDWLYKTEAQTHADGRALVLHQGKAIGGTSTINGMSYTRVDAAQIDAWQEIGNEGWTWDNLYPYYRKQETFQIPNKHQEAGGSSYIKSYHGFKGPVSIGWPLNQAVHVLGAAVQSAYEALGLPASEDPNGGDLRGTTAYPSMMDEETRMRSDAARAYFWPHYPTRSNLALKSGTTVNRLLWSDEKDADGNVVAEAVEAVSNNGTTSILRANKGVIVSAGTIRTPQVLELSGVGNPKILSKANVTTRVNLPGVGENLIDQINNSVYASLKTNATYDDEAPVASYPNVTDLFGNNTSAVGAKLLADLPAYADKIASENNNATSAADLLKLMKVQHGLLFNHGVAAAEVIHSSTGSKLDAEFWATLPFTRGNIHITSNDPKEQASINLNHFMMDWDAMSQAAVAKYIRKLYETSPMNNMVGAETSPSAASVPADATDATWIQWLKENYRSNFHLLSSAAMMPREIGGVVSEKLQLYGTSNVRVVDASVLPFQVSGHLTSTLYAIAERAAEFIEQADGRF
ncbi:hypothetical protein IWZ00DRAFT_523926 [Phyllosticta capitalensis]|uniref:choline dehydrogenase n=1 Tax=Phyllosticta capitalensis TaxID=121624 RepID=UPI003130FC40